MTLDAVRAFRPGTALPETDFRSGSYANAQTGARARINSLFIRRRQREAAP